MILREHWTEGRAKSQSRLIAKSSPSLRGWIARKQARGSPRDTWCRNRPERAYFHFCSAPPSRYPGPLAMLIHDAFRMRALHPQRYEVLELNSPICGNAFFIAGMSGFHPQVQMHRKPAHRIKAEDDSVKRPVSLMINGRHDGVAILTEVPNVPRYRLGDVARQVQRMLIPLDAELAGIA
jgi:hypothetical protein